MHVTLRVSKRVQVSSRPLDTSRRTVFHLVCGSTSRTRRRKKTCRLPPSQRHEKERVSTGKGRTILLHVPVSPSYSGIWKNDRQQRDYPRHCTTCAASGNVFRLVFAVARRLKIAPYYLRRTTDSILQQLNLSCSLQDIWWYSYRQQQLYLAQEYSNTTCIFHAGCFFSLSRIDEPYPAAGTLRLVCNQLVKSNLAPLVPAATRQSEK